MTDFGLVVAEDPTTPPETLRRFYFGSIEHGHPSIRRAVLVNPNTPADILFAAIKQYDVDTAIFNPSLPLMLLENFPPIIADRFCRRLLSCTADLLLDVPRETWLDLAQGWLAHVALPRQSVHTIPEPRRWQRNLKNLEKSRYDFPTRINTHALIDNATSMHENKAGALMVLVERARPLRARKLEQHRVNDARIDRLDYLLGRPRQQDHARPVPVTSHKGKVESYLRVSRKMDTLPGLDL